MNTNLNESTRTACTLICAAAGNIRAARGAIAKALQATIPHRPRAYISAGESKSYGLRDPRYTFECTEKEFEAVTAKAAELAKAAGFDQSPFDSYRD